MCLAGCCNTKTSTLNQEHSQYVKYFRWDSELLLTQEPMFVFEIESVNCYFNPSIDMDCDIWSYSCIFLPRSVTVSVPKAPLHHQSTETFLGSKNTLTKLWSYSIKYSSGHIKHRTGCNDLYYSASSLRQDLVWRHAETGDTKCFVHDLTEKSDDSLWGLSTAQTLINWSSTDEWCEAVTSFNC